MVLFGRQVELIKEARVAREKVLKDEIGDNFRVSSKTHLKMDVFVQFHE